MNLGDEVDLEDYVSRPDKISAAEVCLLSLYFFGGRTVEIRVLVPIIVLCFGCNCFFFTSATLIIMLRPYLI